MLKKNNSILSFSTFEELKSIKLEWDELYLLSEVHSHYLTFEFIDLWYNCFAVPDQIRIYRIEENSETIGFLPLILINLNGMRILSSLTNYHCMHCGPLVRKGFETVFQNLLLKELFNNRPDWDILKYASSYDFDRFPGLFPPELLNTEKMIWLRSSQPTYTTPLNLSFEVWAKESLSKNTYQAYRNLRNKYTKTSDWSLQQFRGQDALDKWETFLELESSGWKGEGESSIKMLPENYTRYYKDLVAQLAERGNLWISLLEYANQYIAGAFIYREDDIIHVFKTAYNEDFKQLSPSNMLLLESIRFIGEQTDAPKILHMFPNDYGYKGRYLKQDYQCHYTEIYNSTCRGKIAYMFRKFKNLIKSRFLKKNSQRLSAENCT